MNKKEIQEQKEKKEKGIKALGKWLDAMFGTWSRD